MIENYDELREHDNSVNLARIADALERIAVVLEARETANRLSRLNATAEFAPAPRFALGDRVINSRAEYGSVVDFFYNEAQVVRYKVRLEGRNKTEVFREDELVLSDIPF